MQELNHVIILKQVELDVVAKNSRELKLYKSCEFKEKSVMNYL